MKLMPAFLLVLFFQSVFSVTFSEAIINLRKLESYIKQYKTEKKSTASLTHLITSYIREEKYKGTAWSIAAGSAPKDLHQYITKKDTEKKLMLLYVENTEILYYLQKKNLTLYIYLQ